ncbi:Bilirubin oxidase [Natronococcus pandeyae]|uniref:Bilirubin oxidase n=1 Tax=Natronococcus pandeyae TaxID=2055836 RepID=A0A8J8TNJ5_9EURY|nr:Bilirubin oxidase [Natronococcus pandeyae]
MGDRTKRPGLELSRRELVLATGAGGISAFAGCTTDDSSPLSGDETETGVTITDHSSPDLEKWVDEVPRPEILEPSGTKEGQPYYEVEMREVEQRLHSDLSPTTVWGYDGQYPGPTIEAEQGEPIYVRWKNDLPDEHLLPVDTTLHSDAIPYDMPGVRTVTHLHGGNVEAESDGNAQAWFTRDFEETGPGFEQKDYYYVNEQPPSTMWYHDHAMGITRLNVYTGLSGFYLLRNDHERELDLPSGECEIPLAIQDRSFEDDGSLFYPTAVADEQGGSDDSHPDPSVVPEFYGDTPVVNGKAWPRLSVEPRPYRLRLLNGSNSRFYRLELLGYDESSGETGADGPSFVLIGNDGGLLSEPIELEDRLELGSSQRADVVVDFSDYAGETLLLHNDAPAMYRGDDSGESDDIVPLHEVMLVDVADSGADTADSGLEAANAESNATESEGDTVANDSDTEVDPLPSELTRVPEIPVDSVDTERYLTLAMDTDEYGRSRHLLGTEDERSGIPMMDPVTETPTLGDTEIWSLANFTGMSHPIHLHLVHFQVLGRQPVGDYDPDEDAINFDALEDPEPFELGWNDVVTVHPAEVVHVIARFGEFEGLFTDQTGRYMWHCHMVEHEDHDMMRPFEVVPPSDEDDADSDDNSAGDDTKSATDNGDDDSPDGDDG